MIQSRGKRPSQRARGPNIVKGSVLFLARPRELRGKMFKGLVLMKSPHLTQREADGGYVPRFLEGFLTLGFYTHRSKRRPLGRQSQKAMKLL